MVVTSPQEKAMKKKSKFHPAEDRPLYDLSKESLKSVLYGVFYSSPNKVEELRSIFLIGQEIAYRTVNILELERMTYLSKKKTW
jgi:hypothetical protein